jgi:hypothetical protein
VIGGLERWRRRIDSHARELERSIAALDDDGGPIAGGCAAIAGPGAALRVRAAADRGSRSCRLGAGAVDGCAGALASRARPSARAVGARQRADGSGRPGRAAEVQLVLAPRLRQVAARRPACAMARCSSPAEAARGLVRRRVRARPRRELFRARSAKSRSCSTRCAQLGADSRPTTASRAERLALRLAVRATRERAVLSRGSTSTARARACRRSTLRALRAAEGVLPGFDELSRRAETSSHARLGWPAPADPRAAIDAAEYDLAQLAGLEDEGEAGRGTARYLLGANPHLARALRFRARRWEVAGWTPADGLVRPSDAGRRALAAHALGARSYSPTALQHYALCPYKFFLYAVWKLAPREEPEAIEELDPLQRGSLVHAVQFELFGALRDAAPARDAGAARRAWDHLDAVLGRSPRVRGRPRACDRARLARRRRSVRRPAQWLRRASSTTPASCRGVSSSRSGCRRSRRRPASQPVSIDAGVSARLVPARESSRARGSERTQAGCASPVTRPARSASRTAT